MSAVNLPDRTISRLSHLSAKGVLNALNLLGVVDLPGYLHRNEKTRRGIC